MNYTFATVIVNAVDQAQAQADLGSGFFTVGLSQDGTAPATHYMSSGPFDNTELDFIANQATWTNTIKFGNDWQGAVNDLGLIVVSEA